MSDILNNPSCATAGGNYGIPTCPIDPGIIVGAILTDVNKEFTAEELADLITVLQAAAVADEPNRIQPIFRFTGMTDNTADLTVATEGYGAMVPVKEGHNDWTFDFRKGGICYLTNLRTFNNLEKRALFVDDKNRIYGIKTTDEGLQGFALDFIYTYPLKFNDGSNPTKYRIRFAQAVPSEWDAYGVYQSTVDVSQNIKGILDLELKQVEVAHDIATVKVQTKCDKLNLYIALKTLLNDPTLWVVTKAGVAVVVDSVTADDENEAFDIGFSGTGVHVISLASAETLAAADIGGGSSNGYESDTLSVTMTAGS